MLDEEDHQAAGSTEAVRHHCVLISQLVNTVKGDILDRVGAEQQKSLRVGVGKSRCLGRWPPTLLIHCCPLSVPVTLGRDQTTPGGKDRPACPLIDLGTG